MKTPVTMRFDDDLLALARAEAFRSKTTLTDFFEDAVRLKLHQPGGREGREPFRVAAYRPAVPGMKPGLEEDATFAELLDAMDEEE